MSQSDDHSGGAKANLLSGTFPDIPAGPRQRFPRLSRACQDVPGRSENGARIEFEKPNPIRPLTSRHLAAARLLARGMRTDETAAMLGTTRQTINAWRRRPGFAAELRRLHEVLASAATTAPPTPARRLAGARQRDSGRDEDVAFLAKMDRLLAPPARRREGEL